MAAEILWLSVFLALLGVVINSFLNKRWDKDIPSLEECMFYPASFLIAIGIMGFASVVINGFDR